MTTQLAPTPVFKAFDNVGLPLAFGKLYTYQAGTTTPQATYTDSTGNTPNPNPITLNARGETPLWLNPTLNYKFALTDALGNQIPGWPVDNISGALFPGQSIIPNTDNAYDLGSSTFRWRNGYFATQLYVGSANTPIINGGNVSYWQRTAAEIAAGVTPTNYAYAPGWVQRYGVVGNGTTDDTTALQNCYNANSGLDVYHGSGLTIAISSPVTLKSGSRYYGKSAIIQKAGANMGAGSSVNMLTGTSCTFTVVEGLEINGNAANNATGVVHGVQFIGGNYNYVRNCYVHDTTQAGIYLAEENGSEVTGNDVINCGRNLSTDNHGIMLISNTATPLTNILCSGNFVYNAYRKGITTYALSPGYNQNITIADNIVVGCGLGGIYVATATAGTTQNANYTITGNICSGNYVNYEISECTGLTLTGNTAASDIGGGNFLLGDLLGGVVSGNTSLNSQVAGFAFNNPFLTNNLNVAITGNISLFSNRSGVGYAPGIDLGSSQYFNVTGNICNDTPGSAKQTYGISEQAGADFNQIQGNQLNNTTAGVLHIVGSHTVYQLNPISSAVQQLSVGSIITNSPVLPSVGGVAINRISMTTAGANVTGIIMQPGTFTGMTCIVVNEDATHTATMAASGTSNVADGTSCVIAAATQKTFVWDTGTSLWYHS